MIMLQRIVIGDRLEARHDKHHKEKKYVVLDKSQLSGALDCGIRVFAPVPRAVSVIDHPWKEICSQTTEAKYKNRSSILRLWRTEVKRLIKTCWHRENLLSLEEALENTAEESSDMLSSFRCSNPKVENVATKVTIQENKVFPPVHRLSGAEVDKTHPSMGLSKDERENEETRPSKTPNDPLRASLPCDLEQRPSSNYVDSDMTEEDDHGSTFTILIRFPAWGYPQSKCPTIQMIGSPAEIKPGTDFDSIWTKLGTSSERLNASRLDLSMGNSCDSNSRSPSRPSSEQHRARPSPLGVVHPSNKRQDKKAAKTLSAILLAFIVTWTPYSVFVIANALLGKAMADHFIPKILWQFAYALCYINSTVNPILYALCNPNFRQTYIRILSGRWCADS
eukprot:TCALIF_01728-PA protein Name:"Similar to mAChR-A Muscarinic acetylcholine receptor DM1 (Drosophila melanogaster)" AED:0.50 eAED:0.50 QI:0/0/0/0.5/0/0.25/4/0/392